MLERTRIMLREFFPQHRGAPECYVFARGGEKSPN
jgi:hypothetical protein